MMRSAILIAGIAVIGVVGASAASLIYMDTEFDAVMDALHDRQEVQAMRMGASFCPSYVGWRDWVEANYRETRALFRVPYWELRCSPFK